MPPTRWRRPDVPGASSCRRACALSGRAPEKMGWLYPIGHLVRTSEFSVFLTVCTRGCWNFERELQGQPRRLSQPRDRRKFAEPIGSKAQSSEIDQFQLGAGAELFTNLSETKVFGTSP